jgi:hypothetical protein
MRNEREQVIETKPQVDTDELLKQLQIQQLQEVFKEKAEKKDADDRFKAARQIEVAKAIELEKAKKRNCPHRKPDAKPNLGGQRDHQGHMHFLCLECQSEWIDGELPPELRIGLDGDRFGGPIVGGF